MLRQHDHRRRADEAALRLQRVEVQRQVRQPRRQDAARRAAGQVGVQRVAVGHAAAILVDQLAQRDPGRRQLDPRLAHATADAKPPQPAAAVAAVRREPVAAALEDLSHPEERLDVVHQRRAAEQPALGDIRRAQPRHAAPALDRFDHRRLLAADIGAGAAAQLDRRQRQRCGALQGVDLGGEHRAQPVVLVAQVDPDRVDAGGPGRDQHAFEEAVRVALQAPAVLEGAGLALVGVDRHQPRRRLRAHDAPLARGRESGATEPAQPGAVQLGDQVVDIAPALGTVARQRIAAGGEVGGQVDMPFDAVEPLATAHRVVHRPGRRVHDRMLVHDRDGRTVAAADAGRADDSRAGAEQRRQPREQIARAGELARQAVADAHGQRRRGACRRAWRIVLAHDLEVVVEARDLEDLGLRQPQPLGERREVRCRQPPELVVDEVQVFDQSVAPRRRVAAGLGQPAAQLGAHGGVDAASARGAALARTIRFGNSRSRRIGRPDGFDRGGQGKSRGGRAALPLPRRRLAQDCATVKRCGGSAILGHGLGAGGPWRRGLCTPASPRRRRHIAPADAARRRQPAAGAFRRTALGSHTHRRCDGGRHQTRLTASCSS